MDFELTETQRGYRDLARGIAQEQLLPGYRERERRGRIEPELRREIGALGLIAPELPTELGGRDLDRLTAGVVTGRSSPATPHPRSRTSGCPRSAAARRSWGSG
ncbi:MAG: acyl-CoA dehydrogenase family protein [Pseudonocardia sp.]|nr:acyl-CoA dehydrogenase family protein [Pseudonocardia sp.]